MGAFSDLRLSFRRSTLLLAVLAAATFPTLAAAATTQLIVPAVGTVTNPCTGDVIAVEGFVHTYIHMQPDGAVRMYTNTQDVSGETVDPVTFLPTGAASYVTQSTQHVESDVFFPLPGTKHETYTRTHLVRKGEDGTLVQDDDFLLRTRVTITVSPLGILDTETVELTTDPCH